MLSTLATARRWWEIARGRDSGEVKANGRNETLTGREEVGGGEIKDRRVERVTRLGEIGRDGVRTRPVV